MECPFCKEEIKDGAIKCKHCGAMLADQASMARGANLSTEQKILASDVTEKNKRKFHAIASSTVTTSFFMPKFDPKIQIFDYISWFAFFFTFLYYLVKGMWKKALVLFGGYIVCCLFLSIVASSLLTLFGLVYAVYCALNAPYDLYRLKINNEDFWW